MRRSHVLAAALALSVGVSARAQDGLGGTLPPAPPPAANVADPIGAAFARLRYTEVEDDSPKPAAYYDVEHNHMLTAITTSDCVSKLRAFDRHDWTLDWRNIAEVGPGDTFVYVAGPGVQLGIVGDASQPDQANALAALFMAMRAMQQRCGQSAQGTNTPADD